MDSVKKLIGAIAVAVAVIGVGVFLATSSGLLGPPRNPSITVTVDKVGVYDDCDWDLGPIPIRGAGEIYLYVVATDGNVTRQTRLPAASHYELNNNESCDVGESIFSVSEVGDYLSLSVIAYESDGGGFEPLVQEALAGAVTAWVPGAGLLSYIFQADLAQLIGKYLLGSEDDFVGCWEYTWYKADSWGAGPRYKEDQNLRLWFTIHLGG